MYINPVGIMLFYIALTVMGIFISMYFASKKILTEIDFFFSPAFGIDFSSRLVQEQLISYQ